MTQNEHVYAICFWPEVGDDVISGRNVKTIEGYLVVNFKVASASSFPDIKKNHFATAVAEADIDDSIMRNAFANIATDLSVFKTDIAGSENVTWPINVSVLNSVALYLNMVFLSLDEAALCSRAVLSSYPGRAGVRKRLRAN